MARAPAEHTPCYIGAVVLAGLVMVVAAAAAWGTWSLFVRPTHLPGTITTPIVFVVMGLVALVPAMREPRGRWDRATWWLLAGNAALDALNTITFFAAIGHTTVAIAVLTHYLCPIMVALAAPRIDRVAVPGARPAAVVALAGLVLVLEPWHTPAAGALVGALLGASSATCYAANTFVVRRLAARIGTATAVSYHSLLAAVVMLPLLACVPVAGGLAALPADTWLRLAIGGAVLGAGAGILYVAGLARIGSARAAILTYVEPIVAVAVGVLAWGETLHPIAVVGGALVVGAGVHVARAPRSL